VSNPSILLDHPDQLIGWASEKLGLGFFSDARAIGWGTPDDIRAVAVYERWTGTDWQQLDPSVKPWARAAATVSNDPAHGNVVLFGGLASVNPWNTWTWDGNNWTELSLALQPPNRPG